jgi:hypothetical protein
VLRRGGQRYEFPTTGRLFAEIETARKEHVIFKTLEKLPVIELPVRMIPCAAIRSSIISNG